ncbi:MULTISPECIES: hypothetical protein [Ureibacillus]|uniref:hypothetical protein n=1 Tax=Ureibacillus TaxID=160795 RepID=UPI001E3A5453|nr:hypothetical protein [Ureibacillus thermosphaericus]
MMYGSIFYNCWGSLIAFTITFAIMFQISIFPSQILLVSFIVALAAFVVMFAVRYLIGYILYTPDDALFADFIEEVASKNSENIMDEEMDNRFRRASNDFQDENPEEIADVVRRLLEERDT